MIVKVAGIVHFDPLCRDRLQKWIQNLIENQSSKPAFVAVEWEEHIFKELERQRPIARKYAQSLWPQATDQFLDTLGNSVAFEADTHVSLLPNAHTIWLDKDRSLSDPNVINVIKDYGRKRIDLYNNYVGNDSDLSDLRLLKKMSVQAWSNSTLKAGNERDNKFADAIIKNSNTNTAEWSIAVVGAAHACYSRGTMVTLLAEKGIACDVTELRPVLDDQVS